MKISSSNILSTIGLGLLQLSSVAVAANSSTVPCGVPVVDVLNGSYYGSHIARYNVDYFLGLPFAQPPVGDLRYRAPQPLNTTWTGFKNATQYGNQCVGYGVSV
jgi:hypothetical protein